MNVPGWVEKAKKAWKSNAAEDLEGAQTRLEKALRELTDMAREPRNVEPNSQS